MNGAAERSVFRDFVPDQDQLQAAQPAPPHQVERLDQAFQVLVRLDVPSVEHEGVVQLISLPNAGHVLVFRRDAEPLVEGIRDDVNLVG